MKKTLVLLLCLGLVGCANIQQLTAPNRVNLMKLSIGMTKAEALKIMGTKTVSGTDINLGTTVINNPYRSEILQGKDKTFEVLYYATDVKKDDYAITDDELTPLIFDNGKLMGWGWSFLQDNAQKYEIRMR